MAATNYTPIYLYNSGTASNVPLAANLGAGELAINYADGKLFYKDGSAAIQVIGWKTTPTTAGGTGLTSYTAGDLPYYASGSALSKLGIGTANYVLTSSGTAPQYVAQSTLTVGNATNAVNVGTTDNTSSSSTYYPTLVSATSGNNPITTSSTKLSFVPSTGILTATAFSGALNGTVGATTPNTGAFTTLSATGNFTPSQTNGIVGTTTNNNANAGSVGEYVVSTVANTSVSLTTNTAANVTSISLTAGDWDVQANVQYNVGATTNMIYWYSTVSTTSGTLGSGSANASNMASPTAAGTVFGATAFTLLSPMARISLSATTTVYLVTQAGFTVSTLQAGGTIRARRIR